MNLLFNRFCCGRMQGELNSGRGKVIKKEVKKVKRVKRWRKPLDKQVRTLVLKRDRNRCTKCGTKRKLHVHHIVHRENGGSDEPDNLITLCDLCHAIEHRDDNVYNIMIKGFWEYQDIS